MDRSAPSQGVENERHAKKFALTAPKFVQKNLSFLTPSDKGSGAVALIWCNPRGRKRSEGVAQAQFAADASAVARQRAVSYCVRLWLMRKLSLAIKATFQQFTNLPCGLAVTGGARRSSTAPDD